MEHLDNAGIYGIRNILNGKIYDPAYRAKMSDAIKKGFENPAARVRLSEAQKKRRANERAAAMAASTQVH